MAKTSDSMLKAIKKYKDSLDEIRFSVKAGGKELIRSAAQEKGYDSIQAYLKTLVQQDTGLEL